MPGWDTPTEAEDLLAQTAALLRERNAIDAELNDLSFKLSVGLVLG